MNKHHKNFVPGWHGSSIAEWELTRPGRVKAALYWCWMWALAVGFIIVCIFSLWLAVTVSCSPPPRCAGAYLDPAC